MRRLGLTSAVWGTLAVLAVAVPAQAGVIALPDSDTFSVAGSSLVGWRSAAGWSSDGATAIAGVALYNSSIATHGTSGNYYGYDSSKVLSVSVDIMAGLGGEASGVGFEFLAPVSMAVGGLNGGAGYYVTIAGNGLSLVRDRQVWDSPGTTVGTAALPSNFRTAMHNYRVDVTYLNGTTATLKVFIDNVPKFTYTDPEFLPVVGTTGLATGPYTAWDAMLHTQQWPGYTTTKFDNWTVRTLAAVMTMTADSAAAAVRLGDDAPFSINVGNVAGETGLAYSVGVSGLHATSLSPSSVANTDLAAGASEIRTSNIGFDTVGPQTVTWHVTASNGGTPADVVQGVTVYRPASPIAVGGTFDLGRVILGSAANHALSITNNVADDGYSEKLNATFDVPDGDLTTNGGSISLLAPGAASTAMSTGLNTATTGEKTGSVVVNFETDGAGTSGLTAALVDSQWVTLTATVLTHADPTLVCGPTQSDDLTIDFGTVPLNAGGGQLAQAFSILNLSTSTEELTALLDFDSVDTTLDSASLSTDLAGTLFKNLLAGTSQEFSAYLVTTTAGTFEERYTLHLSDEDGVGGGTTDETITLVLKGAVVPEPATLSLLGLGGLMMFIRRRRSA